MAIEFPSDYVYSGDKSKEKKPIEDDRLFYAAQIGPNESITLRPCGHFTTGHWCQGFQYFTLEKELKRFATKPKEKDYTSDIGYRYGHGPGKVGELKDGTIGPLEEKDFPRQFLAFTAICKERKNIVVAIIDKVTIKEAIERGLSKDDTHLTPDGILNLEFTITKVVKKQGKNDSTSYAVDTIFKAPGPAALKLWKAAQDGIWTPAVFDGADPFEGKPANSKLQGLPPTARDELGADKELDGTMPEEGW